ncbi:TonB-dependent receptor [Dechloromonas sp. ZY10]|uniref:TonB-dependent receptor plug domain-containing protein n=1 Tax=Dechloromonas aquae TaxID=2664436 RepID=UPI0035278DC6
MINLNLPATCLSLACLTACPASAEDLLQLSLEELMRIEVTSVSKKSQPADQAAAAIHVLTSDDIRRSGATSLPEVLRLVPGVQVARIDGNKWAVSIRGMNARWSGQLLVLQDGRSLYSPLFGGVYWEAQDTPLEDIERIEVIRGPGGTLWGANAVNGVINIITRHAGTTQGGLATVTTGSHERSIMVRQGGQLGEHTFLRAYAKQIDHDALPATAGGRAHDAWNTIRAGFRLDHQSGSDSLRIDAAAYEGNLQQTAILTRPGLAGNLRWPESAGMRGSHLQLHWQRELDNGASWQMQVYLDRAEREEKVLQQQIDTADLELQHRFRPHHSHEIVIGTGYRQVSDWLLASDPTLSIRNQRQLNRRYHLFLQDEIALAERLRLTLGSKFEHHPNNGWEPQPNVRLAWQPAPQHTLWGAWSQTVHTPSRADRDLTLNLTGWPLLSILGTPNFASQRLQATEIGYRQLLSPRFSYDFTVYQYEYDNLRSLEPVAGTSFPRLAYLYGNQLEARARGAELSAAWQATADWRVNAAYSHLQLSATPRPGSRDNTDQVGAYTRSGPRHQFNLQSQLKLSQNVEFDAFWYWVAAYGGVPAYRRLDLRLSWQFRPGSTLTLVGQNLLAASHQEQIGQDTLASSVPRGAYLQFRQAF